MCHVAVSGPLVAPQEGEGGGCLPLEGSIPDMTATTQ
jgi:hypothetical protein